MARSVLVVVAILAGAGCLQPGPQVAVAEPPVPDDGVTSLQLLVVDSVSMEPLADITVRLELLDLGSLTKTTDDDGRVTFNVQPAPACTIHLTRDGYRSGVLALACTKDMHLRVKLASAEAATRPPSGVGPATPPPPEPGPGMFLLDGYVYDAATDAGLPGLELRLDPLGALTKTDDAGYFRFEVVSGLYTLAVAGVCWVGASFDVDVEADTGLDVGLVSDDEPPGKPTGLRATGGPGPGMVTLSWQATPGATGYRILRNGAPFHEVANSQAYGIPGASASDRFSLLSLDACGLASPPSGEVSASPLAGPAPMVPASRSVGAEVSQDQFGVLDLDGTLNGTRAWRVVEGTGNCCENYLTTTRDGRILDQGGSVLAFSDNEGQSWSGVISPLVALAGEGSVTPAPDGDIVAFDWATYNADTAFAYRYSAATKTWHTQPVFVEAPAYDRPWIAVIKGPFFVEDLVVPYVTVVEGGIGLKDPLLISLDGLTYVPSNSLTTIGTTTVDLRGLRPGPDANRDWLGPMAEFGIVPLDNGVGIMERQAAMKGTVGWSGVTLPTIPGEILRVDSAGNWHSASADGRTLTYAISTNGGERWTTRSFDLPTGWSVGEWDFRVNAAQDQAVFAVNADVGPNVQQAAIRFTNLVDAPTVKEILLVGHGDGVFSSGVGAAANRFDFMTLGFLPDGRIVMSGGDSRDNAPFVAIELPA